MSETAGALDDLRYPIGRFNYAGRMAPADRSREIEEILRTPEELRAALEELSAKQLDTPYREGGWTVRQVVHHVADSHLNAYTRFRLGLTEDEPLIKPYDEARWAELADARTAPVELSLVILEALHERWVLLLRSLSPADFERTVRHPQWSEPLTLDKLVALYAWHGRHHTAHILSLRERMGW
jgi:uncharacterized damage-inducible protein DinB